MENLKKEKTFEIFLNIFYIINIMRIVKKKYLNIKGVESFSLKTFDITLKKKRRKK
jgi:hypothetical protein